MCLFVWAVFVTWAGDKAADGTERRGVRKHAGPHARAAPAADGPQGHPPAAETTTVRRERPVSCRSTAAAYPWRSGTVCCVSHLSSLVRKGRACILYNNTML